MLPSRPGAAPGRQASVAANRLRPPAPAGISCAPRSEVERQFPPPWRSNTELRRRRWRVGVLQTCNEARGLQNRSRGRPPLCPAWPKNVRRWQAGGSDLHPPCRSRRLRFPQCSGRQAEGATLAKATGKGSRFTKAMMLCCVPKTACHCLSVLVQELAQRCLKRPGRGFLGDIALGKSLSASIVPGFQGRAHCAAPRDPSFGFGHRKRLRQLLLKRGNLCPGLRGGAYAVCFELLGPPYGAGHKRIEGVSFHDAAVL